MSTIFSIFPHHGYLNTDITISSLVEKKDIMIDCVHETTGLKALYFLSDSLLTFRLSAGKHIFSYVTEEGIQSEEVFIEDAIKLGGGQINGGCLSNKSPWCVIRMTDRVYFHNAETGEEFFEMSVSPEEIKFLNRDNLLLHSKNSGYSLYSFHSRSIVKEFYDSTLYEDEVSIVFKDNNDNIVVLNIGGTDYSETVIRTKNFSINKEAAKLYYRNDKSIIIFDIHSSTEESRTNIIHELITILPSGHYLSRECKWNGRTEIHVYGLVDEKRLCTLLTRHQIVSCNGVNFTDVAKLLNKRTEFCKTLSPSEKWTIRVEYSVVKNITVVGETIYYTVYNYSGIEKDITYGTEIRNSKSDVIIPIGNNASTTKVGENLIISDSSHVSILHAGHLLNEYTGKLSGSVIECKDSQTIIDLEGNVIAQGELVFDLKARNHATYSTSYVNLPTLGYYGVKKGELVELFRFGETVPLLSSKETTASTFGDILILIPADSTGERVSVCNNTFLRFSSSDLDKMVVATEDMSRCVFNDDNVLYIKQYGNNCEEPVRILSKIFDPSKYKEALFTADGNNIVVSDGNNQFYYHNIETGGKISFDPGNYVRHINGYRPLVDTSYTKPRIVDPVSGQVIVGEDKSDYIFYSPDQQSHIDSNCSDAGDGIGFIEYIHKFLNQNVSKDEYLKVARLNKSWMQSVNEDTKKGRLQYMKEHPLWFVEAIKKQHSAIRCRNNQAESLPLSCEHIVLFAEKNDDPKIPNSVREAIDYYVKYTNRFSDAVIQVNEYLKLHVSGSDSTRKIDLGIPLWFLNYVSFSYDGKKMAVAGRYPDNTEDDNKCNISGLFLLYDIEKDKISFKKTNTNAVWVSAFTKDGLVACYDSCPGSYVMKADCPDLEIIQPEGGHLTDRNRIGGRSFLCFSPSGKLMAMSNQGYVRIENATEERPWGHQPSTNVYIRNSNNLSKDIAHFNDHGSGITGVASKARTVSMVAFSLDDSKMLSVSNDGVVVVRNLHLE